MKKEPVYLFDDVYHALITMVISYNEAMSVSYSLHYKKMNENKCRFYITTKNKSLVFDMIFDFLLEYPILSLDDKMRLFNPVSMTYFVFKILRVNNFFFKKS